MKGVIQMSDRRPGYEASNSVPLRMNILAFMESVSAELVKIVDCWSSSCLFSQPPILHQHIRSPQQGVA